MTATLDVPIENQFQVIGEHESAHFGIDAHYFGIKRSADAVTIQVALSEGRSADQIKAFYKGLWTDRGNESGFACGPALKSDREYRVSREPNQNVVAPVGVQKRTPDQMYQ